MAANKSDREYDIVVVGATGYTGAWTASVIAELLPTNLKWAIAGRSRDKLEKLAAELKTSAPDRIQPSIEPVSFDKENEVDSLLQRTRVCISTVAYASAGATIVRACAEYGTDYIDCTGNVPDVHQWIKNHHEKAKSTGAIIIVGSGYFSAPQDLTTWAAANELAKQAKVTTKEAIVTYIYQPPTEVSGGTVVSLGHSLELDPKVAVDSVQPWYLSPVQGTPDATPAKHDSEVSGLGIRRDRDIGLLTASAVLADQDRSFVHRTWGLLTSAGAGYGPNFRYNEYETASSVVTAVLQMLTANTMLLILSSSFLYKYVMKPLFPKPGEGPDPATQRTGKVGVQSLAISDPDRDGGETRALSRFIYESGTYRTTAVFLAQGAASLLYTRKLEAGYEGGILTPAFLGQDYIDRMVSVGAKFETKIL